MLISVCSCSNVTSTDQPENPDADEQLSAEEKLVADQSLSVYCKPVELYNILLRRATRVVLHLFLLKLFVIVNYNICNFLWDTLHEPQSCFIIGRIIVFL